MSSITNPKMLFIPVALLALLVAGAFFAFGQSQTTQANDDDDEVACNKDTEPAGFDCTPLLNKGGGQTVGELFFKIQGGNLVLVTNLFDGTLAVSDTGHVDEKLCLDDDHNPHGSATSCTGGKVKPSGKFNQGDTYSCGALETNAKYEIMVKNLAEDNPKFDHGDGKFYDKYTIDAGDCTVFSFHFNQGDFSIEVFGNGPGVEKFNKLVLICSDDTNDLVESLNQLFDGDTDPEIETLSVADSGAAELGAFDFGGGETSAEDIEEYLCNLARTHGHTGLLSGLVSETETIP